MFGLFGPTRLGELARTAEVLEETAKKYEGDPLRVAMEVVFMLRSTNLTEAKDLQVIQENLDARYAKRKAQEKAVSALPLEAVSHE